MPYAPPRACKCGAVVPAGQKCRRCTKAADQQRGSRHERGYDTSWNRLRVTYLRCHPGCAVCGATDGVDVDHKMSIRERPDLRLEWSNLQTLCRRRHNQKTHGKGYGV
jgi:5-methylcytosine-specific restriction endonuclease McrA